MKKRVALPDDGIGDDVCDTVLLEQPAITRRTSILCVGDELLRGEFINSNVTAFSQKLHQKGFTVGLHMVCGDQLAAIKNAFDVCVRQSDFIFICGGLGPTSDDLTREALAGATGLPLCFDEESWLAVQSRLQGFGLSVHSSNRNQALFPRSATILPNKNGTARGFSLHWQEKEIHVFPGPPKECLPMLDELLLQQTEISSQQSYQWRLLGVIEADIAAAVDEIIVGTEQASVSYLWRYPYVDVRLAVAPHCQDEAVLVERINTLLTDHLVSTDGRSALDIIRQSPDGKFNLRDDMTKGKFAALLPEWSLDNDKSESTIDAWLDGNIEPPYQGTLGLHCQVMHHGERQQFSLSIPKRGPEITDFLCEFIAWSMLRASTLS